MKNKYIIGLGVLALAGIGLYLWKKPKTTSKAPLASSKKNLDVKTVISKLDMTEKAPSEENLTGPTEAKLQKSVLVKEKVVVEVAPVTFLPDRRWLERSWADVS